MNDSPTIPRCGAKNNQGKPCRKFPIRGRTRCRLHGGKTPIGIASPHFKDGRWSRYLPSGLAAKYERAQGDPHSKSHAPDLNLIDCKIADLLSHMEQGNPGERLASVQGAWMRLVEARRNDIRPLMDAALLELDRLLTGPNIQHQWDEIYQCMDLRRKILEAEQRRMKDLQQMISIEELLILCQFISESIKTAVLKHADPESARNIITDVTRDLGLCLSRYASPRSQFNHLNR